MEREALEQAIAALEAQRTVLGDEVVDASVSALKRQLADLALIVSPQEQRKQVTVLFADVSGFTAMSETMDAEDVQATMNALWQQVDKAITVHNGRIDKHIGDAVMALWGSDEVREDDPEQAIRAALAMQTAVHTFATKQSIPLKMRIGLNTGPVLLGEVGTTAEFTAMGDTVNIASRLEHAAPVGGILISHDTYRHVRGTFDVAPQEPLAVKGKTEPLQVYIVKGAKPRAFRLGTRGIEGIETRTVGRDEEVHQLQQAYETAIGERQTTVTTLVGEAGVGKSRLLYEFEQWLELRPEQIRYFKGRAFQQAQGIPHYLLRDMLATRFQILDSDPLDVVRQKFVMGLTEFLTDNGEMKAHILGAWLGYDFRESPHLHLLRDDPEQIRNRATLYFVQFLMAIGERQPLIIFLEDIHWADGGSLDAVSELTRRQSNLPLFVLCLTRPPLYERHPDWGKKIPVHIRLDLSPLSTINTRALVKEILRLIDPLPPLLLDLISSRAEGNPFYAEELIKMLIDDGVIVTGEEEWQVMPEQLLTLSIPSTLTGVLQARLDRLESAEKQVLQQASIIGRIFWDEALTVLHPEANLLLPALQAKEFIFSQVNSAFAETAEYTFKHALLRDVTYETVLKRLRGRYHALVADWLVNAAKVNGRSNEYATLIGEHYRLAGKLEVAAKWYGRAGQQAAATFAHEEAIHYITLALQFIPADDHATRFDLLKAREQEYHFQGNREAQGQDLEQLANLADQLGVTAQVEVALLQGNYAEVTSDYTQAIKYAQMAIEKGRDGENMSLVADGYRIWGQALWEQGKYSSAQEQLQLGLQLAREIGDQASTSTCLHGLGIIAYYQGQYDIAREYYQQSLDLFREVGDQNGEGGSLSNLGGVAYNQGEYNIAKKYFEQALDIFRRIGSRNREGIGFSNLGNVALSQGDSRGANAYFEQALAIFQEVGNRREEGTAYLNLGHTAMMQVDIATAQNYYEQALVICGEIGARIVQGISLHELGAVALAQLKLEVAEAYYQQALALRQEMNQPYFCVEDWAGLAKVKLAQGDRENSRYYGQLVLDYLEEDPRLEGTENRMRVFRFMCEVLIALGQSEAADKVLALAAQLIQEYLGKNKSPHLQEMYLRQPTIQVLWEAWIDKSKG